MVIQIGAGNTPYQSFSGGGGWASLSGLTPPSGEGDITSSGPWSIKTQTLEIDYVRVPSYTHRQTVQDSDVSLSSIPSVSGAVLGTSLVCRVNAKVQHIKSTAPFSSSGFYCPQKFQILSTSADRNGILYPPYPNEYLGPGGSIETHQPFTHRRLWASGDSEYLEQNVKCYTYQYNVSAGHTPYGNGVPLNSDDYLNNFKNWMGGHRDLYECGMWYHGAAWYYFLQGTYTAQQETNTYTFRLQQTLDSIGNNLTGGGWGLWEYGDYAQQTAAAEIAALPHYDATRHDYS